MGPRYLNRRSTTPFSSDVSIPMCAMTHHASGIAARSSQRSRKSADFFWDATGPNAIERPPPMKADYGTGDALGTRAGAGRRRVHRRRRRRGRGRRRQALVEIDVLEGSEDRPQLGLEVRRLFRGQEEQLDSRRRRRQPVPWVVRVIRLEIDGLVELVARRNEDGVAAASGGE